MGEVQIGHGQDGMDLERWEWLFLTDAADTVFQDWEIKEEEEEQHKMKNNTNLHMLVVDADRENTDSCNGLGTPFECDKFISET